MREKRLNKPVKFDDRQLFLASLVYLLMLITFISVVILSYASVFDSDAVIAVPYVLFLPAVLFFFLRRISLRLWKMLLFFSIAAALPMLILFFRPLSEAIFITSSSFLMALIALSARYKQPDSVKVGFDQFGASMFTHGFLLAISGIPVFDSDLRYYLLVHALLSVCIFFLARQHYIFETTYGHIANSPTQPSAAVRSRHNRVILLLSLFSLLIVPVVVLFPYRVLSDFLLNVLQWIIAGLAFIFMQLRRLNLIPDTDKVEPIPLEQIYEETSDSTFSRVMEIFFDVISVIAVILFLYFSVRVIFRFIITMYRRSKDSPDTRPDDLVVDEIFSIQKKKLRKKRRQYFGEGEEKEVRKKYYHFVRRAIRSGVSVKPSDAPEEIRDAVSAVLGEHFNALSLRYEKYRYGTGNQSVNLSELNIRRDSDREPAPRHRKGSNHRPARPPQNEPTREPKEGNMH
ncbi:MAG: hypothetical protein JW780_01620 [Clostridiales bacterium]|nr:hypothetical protein [Clostridiales bacterium]